MTTSPAVQAPDSDPQPVSTHVNVLLQSPNVRLAIHRTLSQRYNRWVDALIRSDSDAAELVHCLRELEQACRTTVLAIPPVEEAKERGGPHA